MTGLENRVRLDAASGMLTVESFRVDDPRVLAECRHWSSGRRGEAVGLDELATADLSGFVRQAITIGSTALTAAAGVQQTYGIEALVAEVEQRSSKAACDAAERTSEAVSQAAAVLQKASEQAKVAVVDAGSPARKSFTESVESAQQELANRITALLGGEEPQLLLRLQPILETFSRTVQERTTTQTTTLIEKVAKQFDPADPASPMAQQMRLLTEQQHEQSDLLVAESKQLSTKVDDLVKAIAVKQATAVALAGTARKGVTYEEQINAVMTEIAAGLGDEYLETGNVIGMISRNKKGDGVLRISGGEAAVVLEMTDSARPNWGTYLREAEENRGAQASLGLARSREQLGGQSVQTLGPRRIVLAFDPERDDPQLLRSVVQLLRLAAEAADARVDTGEIATADEDIAEALTVLRRMDVFARAARDIRKGAQTVDSESVSLQAELTRLLAQARSALAGVQRATEPAVRSADVA